MKNSISFIVLLVVALCANATDLFYIEDFEIAPGETRTVNILLDNETVYTAFQTDIYMPEGLIIEQEDGDYIFDLTSRKSRDHNIASQLQVDGSIRVMSYSPHINAYNGNSGALVTFNVIAADDFAGPAHILLKNTLFTTTAGIEIPFSDAECTVTVPNIGKKGDVNGDGKVSIADVSALISILLSGETASAMADIDENGSVSIADVTALINILLSNNI